MTDSCFRVNLVSLPVWVLLLLIGLQSCREKDDPSINRDTEAPTIYILTPTSEDVYVTTDNSVSISGIAQDNSGVQSVSYSSSSGAVGIAEGLEDWTISNLSLKEGDNVIEIIARDDNDNTGSTSITITKNQYLTFLGVPSIDPGTIYANEDTEIWITATIASNDNLIESSVRLIEVDDNNQELLEICPLYDDGNLGHGDEIKGDNVFSAIHRFNYGGIQTKKFRVAAKTLESTGEVDGYSAVFALIIVDKQVAEQNVKEYLSTQQQIEAKVSEFAGLPMEEWKEELLNWMKGHSSIADVSEESGMIKIVHRSGLASYVMLDPSNGYKGGVQQDRNRASAVIPLSHQTRGTLDRMTKVVSDTRSGDKTDVDVNIIQNKNVLIWAPFKSGEDRFPHAMETSLVPIFDNCPVKLNVVPVSDKDCTTESVLDFTKYGIIVIDTHGKGGDLIFTREETGFLADLVDKENGLINSFVSELYTLVTMGYYDASYTYYAVTSKFIRNKIKNKFPNSIVFNGSCESMKTMKLSNAFINKGAKTYLGFKEVVGVDPCIEKADEFFSALTGAELKNTGESYQYDKFLDGDLENEYLMAGSKAMHFYLGLINGDFEYGNLNGWNVNGDGRPITQLGPLKPVQGYFMGIVSTGLGYTEAYGSISQTFKITNENTLSVRWNFLSEEFMEYVGTRYQDYLKISITDGENTDVLFSKAIDDFADEYSLQYVSPSIVFDMGDAYMTGWQTSTFDIRKYKGKTVTLYIESGDVGDSVFDSATLLDEIKTI